MERIIAPDPWFQREIDAGHGVFDHNSFKLSLLVAKQHRPKLRGVIDIGAHCGSWTVEYAKHFKRVLAFEPNPNNYKYLERNAGSIDNVQIHNFALGAMSGEVQMNPGKDNSGQWHMSRKRGVAATVKPLDSIYFDEDIDLLKMDVEGFEFDVLLGAAETIRKHQPVICLEKNGLGLRYGIDDKVIDQLLKRLGYELVARENKDYAYVYTGEYQY